MITTATKPDIHRLEEADAAALRQIWRETRGTAPPKTLTARLMRLSLAWEVQAVSEGVESARDRKSWQRIMRARSVPVRQAGGPGVPRTAVSEGTRILKAWGATTHEVLITGDGGATWNGQSYSSLSAVARAMTGTNRNGPKFFGLREGAKP
ncbi:hypothetical protein PEL8287_02942 [Roseovarius litorisediminis]|uniref:DUF2924 domain-containing protein n=1 Tax=Roseovarius litorisediminis TaxID=1312363 RepID=A0A1Y5T388_9RHOB|nr:DUF2924 domain-containing protein [Roseovarius litorisediminis]SLN54780.1 hypothetical protein PEL8287_02942 [Roseovarius litorisediminis]